MNSSVWAAQGSKEKKWIWGFLSNFGKSWGLTSIVDLTPPKMSRPNLAQEQAKLYGVWTASPLLLGPCFTG